MENMKIIYDFFKKLYGHPCWNVSTDYGLSLRFGKPRLRSLPIFSKYKFPYKPKIVIGQRRATYVTGQWKLWIYEAHWKLSHKGQKIVTSSSSNHNRSLAAFHLSGQKLVNVKVNEKTGAALFTFDLDCTVEVRRWKKGSKDVLWYLYKPDGYCLSIKGDGTYTYKLSDE
jgi:hypothetical protein